MKRMTWLALAAALLSACELSDAIGNSDFDQWCGDVPCGWEADGEGEIERVSTWHSHDYAVSFEGDDVRLSQLVSDGFAGSCFKFTMVAKVDAPDIAEVELDFLDDGQRDWWRAIPPSDFSRLSFYVKPPRWYDEARISVRKHGNGTVVLAQLSAEYADEAECAGIDPLDLENLPGGALCDSDDNCASETCIGGYCTGCTSDADCDDGEVCGYAPVGELLGSLSYGVNVLPQCIEPSTRPLGELCLSDSECVSGVCCEGACSECCDGDGCAGERTCVRALAGDGEDGEVIEPFLCSAGPSSGEQGDACTSDEECAGACVDLECTGLCLPISGGDINSRCAMLECAEASCDFTCGVETVEVGRCD